MSNENSFANKIIALLVAVGVFLLQLGCLALVMFGTEVWIQQNRPDRMMFLYFWFYVPSILNSIFSMGAAGSLLEEGKDAEAVMFFKTNGYVILLLVSILIFSVSLWLGLRTTFWGNPSGLLFAPGLYVFAVIFGLITFGIGAYLINLLVEAVKGPSETAPKRKTLKLKAPKQHIEQLAFVERPEIVRYLDDLIRAVIMGAKIGVIIEILEGIKSDLGRVKDLASSTEVEFSNEITIALKKLNKLNMTDRIKEESVRRLLDYVEDLRKELESKICPFCHEMNDSYAIKCNKCGWSLEEEIGNETIW